MNNKVRLAYLVSHPIQYQAPLLRRIAQEPGIDLTVFFGSDFSVRGYQDEGFGVDVKWDIPLLDGYRHKFLPVVRDNGTAGVAAPLNRGIAHRLRGPAGTPGPAFDALWVHGYSTVNSMHAMIAAKALGIAVLLRAESWLGDRPRHGPKLLAKRAFFSGLAELVDAVLPIGTHNALYWKHYLGDAVPQFLMPYAVDNAFFQQRSAQASARRGDLQREFGLEAGRPVILFASKLQTRKRCEDLVLAYAQLVSKDGSQPSHKAPYLLIVGDGEERARLEALARESGLPGIRFCGFKNQSELPRFFDLASVFVLPSRHEPWGLIVNEVMNAGRAVIVSDEVGCQPDLITDGVEGAVFPAGDIDALSRALSRVLQSPEVWTEMGRCALRRIQSWSFEEDVQALRRALDAITESSHA